MKTAYSIPKRLRKDARIIVKRANEILDEYEASGLGGGCLTLRQLYYQFVARGFLGNKQKNYKKLGRIIGEARLMGRVSWDAIEDRTRGLKLIEHFSGPQDALNKLVGWYATDLWKNQRYRPEVWIEKDALTGIVSRVCDAHDVPYFSCRGYTSLSEMWRASERLKSWIEAGQRPFIIHFGDHDPSGMDMSRDIFDRLSKTFMASCEFQRVALTMDQILEFNPPPNPAKVTDSRYKTYVAEYGDESWELDALDPLKFRELIEFQLEGLRDEKQWKKDVKEREGVRVRLKEVSAEWESIADQKAKLASVVKEYEVLAERAGSLEGEVVELQKALAEAKKRKKPKRGE